MHEQYPLSTSETPQELTEICRACGSAVLQAVQLNPQPEEPRPRLDGGVDMIPVTDQRIVVKPKIGRKAKLPSLEAVNPKRRERIRRRAYSIPPLPGGH